MRALLNVVLLVGLVSVVAISWDKPLRERVSEMPVVGHYMPAVSPDSRPAQRPMRISEHTQPPPAPQSNGGWMWDPSHRGALDRPAYNQTHGFSGHVYYADSKGAKYWIDAQGQHHYEP
jgi:hypothetical protein